MKVDKVPEELAKSYYIDDNDYQDLHKGMEIISDDEVEMPVKKVGEKLKNLFNCHRAKTCFSVTDGARLCNLHSLYKFQEIVAEKIADMKIGFRRMEMFFVCQSGKCDWTMSSRELHLQEKIGSHIKTHRPE